MFPSHDLSQEIDEAGIEQFYSKNIDALKIKEEDLGFVEQLQGSNPAGDVKDKQKRKVINRASKYFKLPTVDKNPARALVELAYDLAHDPTAIVERIQEDSIEASIEKMPAAVSQTLPKTKGRSVGRLKSKNIRYALKGKRTKKGEDIYKGLEAGLLRGGDTRTELKTQQLYCLTYY